jgi:hypothetical protein
LGYLLALGEAGSDDLLAPSTPSLFDARLRLVIALISLMALATAIILARAGAWWGVLLLFIIWTTENVIYFLPALRKNKCPEVVIGQIQGG